MFTLRQLRYFEALAETLHFGRAARRLNISQPALSTQIAQLEAFFGQTLVDRRPSGVALTPEGDAVLRRARRILIECRDLETLSEGVAEPLSGRLRLGIIASLAPYLLPPLLTRLEEDYPELRIGVRENVTASLLGELARGDLDCVALALPIAEKGTETIALGDDPFLVAVPEGRVDRFASPVAVERLDDERLILLEEGHCLRDQALAVCERAQARDLAQLGATSLTTLLRMVAGGLGVTLVPQCAVAAEGRGGGVAFLPFADPVPSRRLALAFRGTTGRSKDYERLAEIMRDCLAELSPSAP